MPKRILIIGLILCLFGALSAWNLVSIIDEHQLTWNAYGFLLPVGVILVFVRRTDIIPGKYPKILLLLGVLFTLFGFFAMLDNFKKVVSHGEIPPIGTVLLPLGGGLIFGRPFCRAFVRLLLYMGFFAVATSWIIVLLNGHFNDIPRSVLPPFILGLLITADRMLYSARANEFFAEKNQISN